MCYQIVRSVRAKKIHVIFCDGSFDSLLDDIRKLGRWQTTAGVPVITLKAETRQRSGIETALPTAAPYQEQVRAFGTVLNLARLTDLTNSYANAKAQLRTAQAKLAASKA